MNSKCNVWIGPWKRFGTFFYCFCVVFVLCSTISSRVCAYPNSIESYSVEDLSNSSVKHIFRLSLESSEIFPRKLSEKNKSSSVDIVDELISAPRSLSRVKLNSKARKEFMEDSEEAEGNDEFDNKVDKIYDIGEIDLTLPSPSATIRTVNQDGERSIEIGGGQHPVSFVTDKNLPAAHIDDSEGGSNVIELLRRGEIKKRRKHSHKTKPNIHPASSLKLFENRNEERNNMSLRTTFSSPETEESSSIELELSVNGKQGNSQPLTKIQFTNPYVDSQCVAFMSRSRKKRAIMNVWSFYNGKLRLESQKQVPSWMLNGTKVQDGSIINRGEIPQPYSDMIATTLRKLNQFSNSTLLRKLYTQRSSEAIINQRNYPIMLNYILFGDRAKTWKLMLDKTVDNYLRDYFLTSFGRARTSRTEWKGQRNWRKMRQVLLNFMSQPDSNCQTLKPTLSESVELEVVQPQRNEVILQSPSMAAPIQRPAYVQRPSPDPLLRQGFGQGYGTSGGGGGQYGFQTNGQWGQQVQQQGGWGQPQQQQGGWGQPQQQQGWGWGDSGGGGKKSKKKGKKNKKDKKGKKGKKCKKKKGKGCGNEGGGWGWGRPQMTILPVQVPMQQHQGPKPSKIQQLGLDIDAETIKQGLTLWGILALKALPIVVAAFLAVIIYLLIKKHHPPNTGSNTTGPTAPQAQVVYATIPGKGWGWKRRTEGPMFDYYFDDQYPTTSIPNSHYYQDKQEYNNNLYDYYQPQMNLNRTNPSNVPSAMKYEYSTTLRPTLIKYNKTLNIYPRTTYYKPKIKQPAPVEYPKDMNFHNHENEYHDYETEYINKKGILVKPRTKQEEELMKILSKHKKETLDQLMEKWKLTKKQGKWW